MADFTKVASLMASRSVVFGLYDYSQNELHVRLQGVPLLRVVKPGG